MLRNYLKIALRSLIKNKVYSLINIFGLTVGIACCLILIFYVAQEINYDTFFKNSDHIYRIAYESHHPEGIEYNAGTMLPLAPAVEANFPQVKKISRILFEDRVLIRANDKEFFEEGITFADSTFFEIFSYHFLQGDAATALTKPNSVVLTESMAAKYFGTENPIGKNIQYDNNVNLDVTGVVKDVPINSHFTYDFVISYQVLADPTVFPYGMEQWGMTTSSYTYVLLEKNSSAESFEKSMNDLIGKRIADMSDNKIIFFLQPLKDIYLKSHLSNEINPNNSSTTLIILSTIGLFILLIASINYMNLATARSTKRAKEVGVRKVMGAFRFQLVKQFLTESFLITLLALILAIGLVEISITYFEQLLAKKIEYSYFLNWELGLGILGFVFFIGLISGSYPAFFLSRYQPVKVLKRGAGISQFSGGIPSLRKVLVIIQFTLCVLLLFGTLVITSQLDYMRNANMGFKSKYNVVIPVFDKSILRNYQSVKERLKQISNVNSVSAGFKAPVGGNGLGTNLHPNGYNGGKEFGIAVYTIDYDYLNNFGISLLAGRGFSEEYTSDYAKSMVVTEQVTKKLGLNSPHEAIGKKYLIGLNSIEATIVGVTKDFNSQSLHSEINPVVMLYLPPLFREFTVNINSVNIPETISAIEKTWKEFVPDYPFEYHFLDDYINKMYKDEERIAEIISFFAMIAIVIGCLGLFGLSAFSTEQRTKEIGVRKVLGASASSVVVMLTKEFSKLVLISNIIAWPIAYYLMNNWLNDFAFKIDISIWIFIISGCFGLCVALLTVSYQAVKAALANPIDSLRYE